MAQQDLGAWPGGPKVQVDFSLFASTAAVTGFPSFPPYVRKGRIFQKF
jgi:hypothetical protein